MSNSKTKTNIDFQKEMSSMKTVSEKVRYLTSKGIERKEVALILNIRYQHVRNILTRQLKKN
jgi:hypothetical protein